MNPITRAKAIIDGFRNNILRDDESVEMLADARLTICKKCPGYRYSSLRRTYICSTSATIKMDDNPQKTTKGCGCTLSAKVRQNHESCPARKW